MEKGQLPIFAKLTLAYTKDSTAKGAQTIHPDLFTVKPTAPHRRAISPNHATYEERKKQWDNQHPERTTAEYEAAMIRIARECGV